MRKHILFLVDNLTKYVCLLAVPDTSTTHVRNHLTHFITVYGTIKRLTSDSDSWTIIAVRMTEYRKINVDEVVTPF